MKVKLKYLKIFQKKKFSKIKPDSSKNKKLVLDSEILGTALNIDFYNKLSERKKNSFVKDRLYQNYSRTFDNPEQRISQ